MALWPERNNMAPARQDGAGDEKQSRFRERIDFERDSRQLLHMHGGRAGCENGAGLRELGKLRVLTNMGVS